MGFTISSPEEKSGFTISSPEQSQSEYNGFFSPWIEAAKVYSDIPRVIASGLAQPFSNIAGAVKEVAKGEYGKGTGAQYAKEIQSALQYEPRSQITRDALSTVGSAFEQSKLAGLPVADLALMAQTGQAVKNVTTNARNLAPSAADRITPTIGPIPTQEMADLGKKFVDIGGKVPLHSLSQNRVARVAGDWLENLPMSFSPKEANKVAFNKKLISLIGGDTKADLVTPHSFAPAMEKSGKQIGELYSKAEVPIAGELDNALNGLLSEQRLQVSDVERVITNYVGDVYKLGGDTQVIHGTELRKLDSKLGERIRSLPPGDLRGQLSDLQEILRDALEKRLTPDDAKSLMTARKQYAIGKLIEPIVAKNGPTGIRPDQLMARELSTASGKHRMAMGAAGEVGDLASIGQTFLKEATSSGLGERGLILGGILATGKAIPGLSIAAAYNKLGPILSRRLIEKYSTKKAPDTPMAPTKPIGLPQLDSPIIPGSWNEHVQQNIPLPQLPGSGDKFMGVGPIGEIYRQPNIPNVRTPLPNIYGDAGIVPGEVRTSQTTLSPLPELPSRLLPLEEQYRWTNIPIGTIESGGPVAENRPLPAIPQEPRGLLSLAEPIAPERIAPIETIDFKLRQEILQNPAIKSMVNRYKNMASELQTVIDNAINPRSREIAKEQLLQLQDEFASKMRPYGIRNSNDAIGLLRPLYESGRTQLEIRK